MACGDDEGVCSKLVARKGKMEGRKEGLLKMGSSVSQSVGHPLCLLIYRIASPLGAFAKPALARLGVRRPEGFGAILYTTHGNRLFCNAFPEIGKWKF